MFACSKRLDGKNYLYGMKDDQNTSNMAES